MGTLIPPCVFQIAGTGADAPLGTVSAGGGVSLLAGGSLALLGDDWTAIGGYSCTANGFIRVEIGSVAVEVPVTCTAS